MRDMLVRIRFFLQSEKRNDEYYNGLTCHSRETDGSVSGTSINSRSTANRRRSSLGQISLAATSTLWTSVSINANQLFNKCYSQVVVSGRFELLPAS